MTNLASAVVQASVSGNGDSYLWKAVSTYLLILLLGFGETGVINQELFDRRIEVVKTQGHYGVAVLYGFQCSVAKLSHPPSKWIHYRQALVLPQP